jgi:membrane protease subunit HflK
MKRTLTSLGLGFFLLAALVVVACRCLVAPGEVVVIRRLGQVIEPSWGPGLHWCFPLGIDHLDRVRSDAVRQVTIGWAGPPRADLEPSLGEVMTGDLNLVRIQATVQYRVANPVDYVLRAEPVEPLLARAADASLARALARRGVDAVLRSDRQVIAREVESDLQGTSDRHQLGVAILSASLTDARPPGEVAADFAAAQAAESHRDRRLNEAHTYREVSLATADSTARATLEAAHAAAERTVLAARAEAHRFSALMAEAQRSRALTIRRLYIESLQALLNRVQRKLILPTGDAVDLTVLGVQDEAAPLRGLGPIAPHRPEAQERKPNP